MRLYEIFENSKIQDAAAIIHAYVANAVPDASSLDNAVAYLLQADPSLRYTGPMYRLITFDKLPNIDDYKSLLANTNGVVSFTRSADNWKSILNNLYDAGIANSGEGIILQQQGVGLDVNSVLNKYVDEEALEIEGDYVTEEEVLTQQTNASLLKFFADDGNTLFNPDQFEDFKSQVEV